MGTGSAPYSEGFPLSSRSTLFLTFLPLLLHLFDFSLLAVYSGAFPPTLGTWLVGCGSTLVFKLPPRLGGAATDVASSLHIHSASVCRSAPWLNPFSSVYSFTYTSFFSFPCNSSVLNPLFLISQKQPNFCPFVERSGDSTQRVSFVETGEVVDPGALRIVLRNSANRFSSILICARLLGFFYILIVL